MIMNLITLIIIMYIQCKKQTRLCTGSGQAEHKPCPNFQQPVCKSNKSAEVVPKLGHSACPKHETALGTLVHFWVVSKLVYLECHI